MSLVIRKEEELMKKFVKGRWRRTTSVLLAFAILFTTMMPSTTAWAESLPEGGSSLSGEVTAESSRQEETTVPEGSAAPEALDPGGDASTGSPEPAEDQETAVGLTTEAFTQAETAAQAAAETTAAEIAESLGALAASFEETVAAASLGAPRTDPVSFGISATVSSKEILSGGDFNYYISYTVPPLEDNQKYSGMSIVLTLPDSVTLKQDDMGNPLVLGQEVDSVIQIKQGNATLVTINLKPDKLSTGTTNEIDLNLTTENFKFIDGSKIKLLPKVQGFAGDQAAAGEIPEAEAPEVTVRAEDDWEIKKSVGAVDGASDPDFYLVPYTIVVQNKKGGQDSDGDRNGRLDLESFLLTDTLPTGYPAGGGAAEIVSLKLGNTDLVIGEDYTVQNASDGSIESVQISAIGKAGDRASYLGAGSPVTTTYTMTVKYPKAPYVTPSNQELRTYQLDNWAQIDYKLLGGVPQVKKADAPITLGEKEVTEDDYSITVKKILKIGEESFPIETSGLTASFALYTDPECTKLANNANGTAVAGLEQATGTDGKVVFEHLRRDTYYLKETLAPAGFSAAGTVVKVTVGEQGMITAEAMDAAAAGNVTLSENTIELTNPTSERGALHFVKYGKDAEGNIHTLAGATFRLTSTDTPSGAFYEAVSDSNGLVQFIGIPAGEYQLKEASLSDDLAAEYPLSGKVFSVSVTANANTVPNLDGITLSAGEVNGFLNESQKGRLQIQKISSAEGKESLAGAEFKLYGPFVAPQADIQGADPVQYQGADYILKTEAGGLAKTIPLEKGYYLLQEVTAPTGYALPENPLTQVEVIANQINETPVEISNDPIVKVTFSKTGVVGNSDYTEPLAGATFEIYDQETGGTLLAAVTTKIVGDNQSSSDPVELAPGTYYYIETVPPEGYSLPSPNLRTEFTVPRGQGQLELSVEDHAYYGQIKVIKKDAADDGILLGGVEFEILKKNQAGQLESTGYPNIKTGQDGVGLSKVIPSGTYYLREVSAPTGYQPLEGEVEVTVTENAQVEISVANERLKQIQIEKTDSETGEKLSGVVFGIFTDSAANVPVQNADGTPCQAVTGSDGAAVFENLKPGTDYYVKEISTVDGYILDSSVHHIRTTDGTSADQVQTEQLTNQREAKIVVQKRTDMDAADPANPVTPLSGAGFTLYRYDAGAPDHIGAQVGSETFTDAAGELSFDGLTPGDSYILVETTVPEGHEKAANVEFRNVAAGLNQGAGYAEDVRTVVDHADHGKIKIEKYAADASGRADTTKPLRATFNVYTSADASGTPVAAIETNAEGAGLSGWLTPGTYYIKEVSVQDQDGIAYTPDPTIHSVTVQAAETNTELTGAGAVVNVAKGKAAIAKKAAYQIASQDGTGTDAYQKYDLKGAVIKLFRKQTDSAVPVAQAVAADIAAAGGLDHADYTFDLTNNSSGISDFLDAGEYWIVETTCPDGYTMPLGDGSGKGTAVVTGGQTVYAWNAPCAIEPGKTNPQAIEIDNVTDQGKIRLTKNGFYDMSRLLDGAQFELYVADPNGAETAVLEQADGTTTTVTVSLVSGSASTDAGGNILESGTAGTGQAVTVNLEPGTYYLKEVSTEKITGGPWYWYHQWTGPIVVEEGKESGVTVSNYKMEGEGVKTGEADLPVAGAVFGAFENEADAIAMQAFLEANYQFTASGETAGTGWLTRADMEASLKDAAYLSAHQIIAVSTATDADGKFTFTGLVPEQTYYVVELLPPEGYMADTTNSGIKAITVNADGTGFTTDLTFHDEKLGRLSVLKWTTIGEKNYTVEGVSFEVYRAVLAEAGTQTAYSKDGTYYQKKEAKPFASGVTGSDGLYTSILLPAGIYIVEENSVDGAGGIVTKNEAEGSTYRIVTVTSGATEKTYTQMADGSGFFNPAAYGKFLLKKEVDGNNLYNVKNVTFVIQKKNGESYENYKLDGKSAEFKVQTNGTRYESPFLPPGEYRIYEKAASGLTVYYDGSDDSRFIEFMVEAGKFTGVADADGKFDGTVPEPSVIAGVQSTEVITVVNAAEGELTIEKRGFYSPDNQNLGALKGVEFGLYSDEACQNLVGTTKKTNDQGKITWSKLDAGDYWLKEISTHDSRYTLPDSPVWKVTIEKGVKNTSLTGNDAIQNLSAQGKIKIKKVDANDTAKSLEGAVFGIYSDSGCTKEVARITTNSSGIGESPLIPANDAATPSYYVKEITPPSGYLVSSEVKTVTVASNQTTDLTSGSSDWFQDSKEFSIQVTKKNARDNSLVKGAVIGLFTTKADAEAGINWMQKKETGTDGLAAFTGLVVEETGTKTYYIRELSVPMGFELNPTVFEMEIRYDDHKDAPVLAMDLINNELGKIAVKKVGDWKQLSTDQTNVGLENAVFEVYKVAADQTGHQAGDTPVTILTTLADGTAVSKGLPEGWYELVEIGAPDGYALLDHSLWVQVTNNTTNDTYQANPIKDTANKGRFVLEKYDGSAASQKDGLTGLTGAVFELYRWDESQGAYVYNNPDEPTFTMTGPSRTSGYLLPGRYKLVEIGAPAYVYTDSSGQEHTVRFELDSTPVEFEVKAGATGAYRPGTDQLITDGVLKFYNSPKGSIQLTKYGEDAAGAKETLAGAAFRLYTDPDCTAEVSVESWSGDSLRTTDTFGVCIWENLAPGTYYVKEMETDAVKQAGYAVWSQPVAVAVEAGRLVKPVVAGTEDLIYEAEITNQADQGRLLIQKTDQNGQLLDGAVFAVYAKDSEGNWKAEPEQTQMVTAGGVAISKLLPAAAGGTEYKVVEIQAPSGYTKDESLAPLEKIVTVYPLHNPAAGQNSDKNVVTFENILISGAAGMNGKIDKAVQEVGVDADEVGFADGSSPRTTAHAAQSLLKSDYEVQFKLYGYAGGSNEIGADSFTVTDNDITLWSGEAPNLEPVALSEEAGASRDYRITSLEVLPSANGDRTQTVGANVYIQRTLADKASDSWYLYQEIPDAGTAQTVNFTGSVIGVRVEYQNVQKQFQSEGLILQATFLDRSGWSTETDHEIREIVNVANVEWTDRRLDENGNLAAQKANANSSQVKLYIPKYSSHVPQVSITNEIESQKATYYSGDSVNYKITVENHQVDNQSETFYRPVVSFRMPACTTVNTGRYANGFQITKVDQYGNETVIPSSYYTLKVTEVDAPLINHGNDQYEESDKLKSRQYVFEFSDAVSLEPGEQLLVKFDGMISYDSKRQNGVTTLVCPAYLSSTAKVPKSAENPLGLSFTSHEEQQQLHDNEVTDGLLSDDLLYLNAANEAAVTDSTTVMLVKYIGVKGEDGQVKYLDMGETAQVNPGENLYYKLTLYNNSSENISTARIVDILPFYGDSYVMINGSSFTPRGTTLPMGGGYEDLTLLDVSGQTAGIRIYSTDADWSGRSSGETAAGALMGPMYHRTDSFDSNAAWSSGFEADSSAVAAEIDFGSEGLAPGGTYDVYLTVKTPGYTADQIEDYYQKLIANSAMVSVTRQMPEGVTAPDEVGYQDRTEPERVLATLNLPTGSLGDYVWYDENSNGLQDDGEEPASGVAVSLRKTTYFKVGDQTISKEETVKHTAADGTVDLDYRTDQNGYYEFTGLACNYLKPGAAEGSTDPDDYIGGEYYTYQVMFEIPEGYSATLKGQGNDPAVDSNMNSDGSTDPISLRVLEDENGGLYGEADTTIDAGLISPYAIGDTVWLDWNNNGVQDEGESGVAGVPVLLYKVGEDGVIGEGQGYYARMLTDEKGLYRFENLPEGYYIVRFDISELRKADGYTYAYDFTKSIAPEGTRADRDSDAKHWVDEDGRIRQTDVITLTRARLIEDNIYVPGKAMQEDNRYDAGLVVYSAIGGFCFDDRDYDDVQSLYIPLPGTKVELYPVEEDGSLAGQPAAETTVGADGTYYFDHLVFDGDTQDYKIRFVFPEGYTGVDGNVGTDDTKDSDALYPAGSDRREGYTETITLAKDSVDTTWDAGARKYAAIGDFVWRDLNRNGKQDSGEPGISGVRVVLQSRADANSDWTYYGETLTDENGYYLFEKLRSSDEISVEYRVVFALGSETLLTNCQQAGVPGDLDSDAIVTYRSGILPVTAEGQSDGGYVTRTIKPGYGETDLTWDAGVVELLGAIGDYAWFDDNYNGIQEPGELPAAGIPVVLERNMAGDPEQDDAWFVVGETLTDANGLYLFENLPAGLYRVRFQVPDGYVATKYDQTEDTAVDSDLVIRAGDRWFYTRAFQLAGGQVDLTWDAGIYKPKRRVETVTENEVKQTVIRRNGTKTGDTQNLILPAAILVVCAGALSVLIVRRKKKKEQ